MTTENENIAATPAEVTSETVDKYFESAGEEGVAEVEEQPTDEQPTEEQSTDNQSNEESDASTPEEVTKKQSIDNNLNAALREEREKRRALDVELKTVRDRTQQLENLFSKMMPQQGQPEQRGPSYEDDPLGALLHNQELLAQQIQYQNQQTQQQTQYQQQQAQQQQYKVGLEDSYKNSAIEFASRTPDFADAYTHLVESRGREYIAAGYTQEQASELVRQDEYAIAEKAQQDGVNAGERVYALAKARGYTGKAATASTPNKLANIESGMRKNQSLSNVQGGASSNKMTLEQFSEKANNLSPADFQANWERLIGKN